MTAAHAAKALTAPLAHLQRMQCLPTVTAPAKALQCSRHAMSAACRVSGALAAEVATPPTAAAPIVKLALRTPVRALEWT
ncbi:hypothetical protein FHR50_001069 [Xanthomonas arboricola]|nr:hypothetical protein [Xanthomonas campestris pv. esculenti]